MSEIIIAIDGHSSTGKSTLAKSLAHTLGYRFIDTGAMYRAVSLFALRKDLIKNGKVQTEALVQNLPDLELRFKRNPVSGQSEIYLNGGNVENEIRKPRVSEVVSLVAVIPEVRKKLVAQQHEMGKEKGLVMDGRDIGTVVFPTAELKIFMTASAKIRAQRRFKELQNKGIEVTFEEVYENVKERDRIDSTRAVSPLRQAADAKVLDNSELSQEEQFELALAWAHEAIQKTEKSKIS